MKLADIYCRISEDKVRLSLAVVRQEAECRALAIRLGFEVRHVFIDNDISATKGKVRPAFEALLQSKPAAIIAWHQDRILRLGKDLERVIDLNVPVFTVAAGTLDLTNATGRAVARTVAAWSQYEGEQKAARQLAKNAQLAESGMPVPGRRRFGFEAGNIQVRPDEAAQVRRLFAEFIDGTSLRTLAKNLNWTPRRVRDTLANPGYAGYVVRHGARFEAHESVGRIIDRPLFEAVQARLSAEERRVTPGPGRRHVMSGIARCGVCGGPLSYRNAYLCLSDLSHPCIKKELLEDRVREEVVASLIFGKHHSLPESGRVAQLDARLVELDSVEAELAEALAGGMSFAALAPHQKKIDAQRSELESERAALLAASVQAQVVANLKSQIRDARTHRVDLAVVMDLRQALRARFDALGFDHKRELIQGLLEVTVDPGRGADRVRVRHVTADDLNAREDAA